MKIEIRKTEISDAEKSVKFSNEIYRITYADIMPSEIFDKRDAEYGKRVENFGKWGLNESGNISYVAADDDKIIGFLMGSTISGYDHYKELRYADLTAIYIHTEYQRQGLGKKFFDIAVREFRKQGCKKMTIGVLKDNFKARKAYEKWGCALDTTYEKFYKKYEFTFPEVFYIYDLAGTENNELSFKQFDVDLHHEFLLAAHSETFFITFGTQISNNFFEREIERQRKIGTGVFWGGELIGLCDMEIRKREVGDYGWIHFFYLAPKYRGRGFGKQLIAFAEDFCRGHGLKSLGLRTGENNTAARRLYERSGFVRTSEFDRAPEVGYIKKITFDE